MQWPDSVFLQVQIFPFVSHIIGNLKWLPQNGYTMMNEFKLLHLIGPPPCLQNKYNVLWKVVVTYLFKEKPMCHSVLCNPIIPPNRSGVVGGSYWTMFSRKQWVFFFEGEEVFPTNGAKKMQRREESGFSCSKSFKIANLKSGRLISVLSGIFLLSAKCIQVFLRVQKHSSSCSVAKLLPACSVNG